MSVAETLAAEVGFALPQRYNAARLLWDNLPARTDRIAIRQDGGDVTYGALCEEAAQIGNHLLATGAAPGDRIVLFQDDTAHYAAAVMGSLRAGLVPVLLNTLSPPDLVRFYLEDSGAVAAVVSEPHRDLFTAAQREGTACRTVLVDGQQPWAGAANTLEEAPTGPDSDAFWMYSSGSTGRPKGIVHRHRDAPYTAHTYARHILRIGPDDVCFSVPKIYFAYGFGNSLTFPMSVGAGAVLMEGRPDPAAIFGEIARHRPTILFGLPTLYTALARHPLAAEADLSSVRLCISAAEVLSAEIAGAWKARFGHAIVEGLGSTEMLHIYLSNDERVQTRGSAGRVVPGYRVKLVTPDGADAGQGEEGVLWAAGASAARAYWQRPDKTAETMVDGWIVTGDRFTVDEGGNYVFRGRADDLVKVSGQWVWPHEIELALNEHPSVTESCVLAVPLPDERITVKAFVAPAPGAAPGEALAADLRTHAKRVLLPHKYPREIVFMETLPKTGTGKIDRQALRQHRGPTERRDPEEPVEPAQDSARVRGAGP